MNNTGNSREKFWIELAAVIITSFIVGAGFMGVLALVFICLRWSLGTFGIVLTINRFIAVLFILTVVRFSLSYLSVRTK